MSGTKRFSTVAFILGAAWLHVAAESANAHGSWTPPPPDRPTTRPPVSGGPTPPSDSTGGPTTPGPTTGGPTTSGGGPTTPVGPPTTGGGGGAKGPLSGRTGGKKNRGATTATGWDTWWRYNREPYLNLRARMARAGDTSGRFGFLGGDGHAAGGASAWRRPTQADVRELVAPTLLRVLGEEEPDIVDSALIALGRSAHPDEAADLVASIEEQLGSAYPSVRQAAILGLGMLGDAVAAPALWSIMHDTRDGRALLDRSSAIPPTDRALAALSVGFSAGPRMVPQLVRLFERASADEVDVLAATVLTLGLIDGVGPDVIPFLADELNDRKLDRRVRAQIPITLARLGDEATATVPSLLALATGRGVDVAVRHSSIIALGELAAAADREVITGLRKTLRKSSDSVARQFAYIALARIGARGLAEQRSAEMEAIHEIRRQLLVELVDPSHQVDLAWCALAIGVLGHEMPLGVAAHQEMVDGLVGVLKRTRNPAEEGAIATALGMLRGASAGDELLVRFEERSDPTLRRHLAVALGMMEHRPAAEALRMALHDEADAELRVAAATGLGLMGDRTAAEALVAQLHDAPTYFSVVSIARALGRIGDRSHLQSLVDLIEDDDQPDLVRGFGCVALGLIAERTALAWNAPLSIHSNYLVGLNAQAEVLDIL